MSMNIGIISFSELSVIVKACDQISELVQYLLSGSKASYAVPQFVDGHLTTIIICT